MEQNVVKLMKKHYTDDTYYNAQALFSVGAKYNNMLSVRNDGKSYQIKHYCLLDALINKHQFIYLRRYAVETKIVMVNSYFGDVDIEKMSKITGVEFDAIRCTAGEILAFKLGSDGKQMIEVAKLGRYFNLASAGHIKSNTFVNYKNIIYEEYVTEQGYLFDEPRKLQDIVSTVFRDNVGVVFLMGNILTRLNPYLREWGIADVKKMREGEIRTYECDGVKIAVEHCANTARSRGGGMFYGKAKDNIVEGGYITQSYPHLPLKYDDCVTNYALDLEHENMMYTLRLMSNEEYGLTFVFIHPTEKMKCDRRITRNYNENRLYTAKLTPITKGDIIMVSLLKEDNIFYADNLTGTEFKQIRALYGM